MNLIQSSKVLAHEICFSNENMAHGKFAISMFKFHEFLVLRSLIRFLKYTNESLSDVHWSLIVQSLFDPLWPYSCLFEVSIGSEITFVQLWLSPNSLGNTKILS
jgi:hypothetical protein